MSARLEAIEDANPNSWNGYGGSRWENMMLRRINSAALHLPEKFSERTLGGLVIAYGETVDDKTTIHVHQKFPNKKHNPAHLDTVELWRGTESGFLLNLEAERVTIDETDMMRIQRFALIAEDNKLSLFKVMRSVSLARRAVEDTLALQYLSRPEASLPQLF